MKLKAKLEHPDTNEIMFLRMLFKTIRPPFWSLELLWWSLTPFRLSWRFYGKHEIEVEFTFSREMNSNEMTGIKRILSLTENFIL